MNEATAETSYSIPHSFFVKVLEALQVGIENTEEIFVQNGSRNTRTERMNAARLEAEIVSMKNILTELQTFIY